MGKAGAIGLGLFLAAGPAAGGPLTLREAIERGLAGSPLLAAADHERVQAAAGIQRARAGYLPRLELSHGYARSDQPVFAFGSKLNQGNFTSSDFELDRLNHPGPVDNFRTALTLRQPLFTGGRTSAGLEQAEAGREIADLQSARTRQEVVFQVARAYFGLQLAQERQRAVDASLRAAEANLALAQSRFRAGLAVESDVLAAEVRLARLREDASSAGAQLTVAQAALNDAVGLPLDEPQVAVDPLALRPARDVADVTGETQDRRPDYRALLVEERARERVIRVARSDYFPTIGLEGTYELNTEGPVGDGQGSWSVMAVLRWNLFNGGADQARVREAEAARDRARAVRARAASLIGLEAREARARWTTARERAGVAERAITQAEETLRIVQVRYRGGLATIVDLLTAEAALTESRTRLSEAVHDYSVALAAWELALGRLDPSTFP